MSSGTITRRMTLCNETGGLDVHALHFPGRRSLKRTGRPIDAEGMPAADVLATGKPVVMRDCRYRSLSVTQVPPLCGVGV